MLKLLCNFTSEIKIMAFSSIKHKRCKCSIVCDNWPTMGYAGYFSGHAPQDIKDKIGSKQQVAKRNAAKRSEISRNLHKEQNAVGNAELKRWFDDRHKEMTGKCKHCNGKTQKGQNNFINSIAHILPKAYFKSVATHPENWIELCFYGNSCHTNLDNYSLDIMELNCFDEVVKKFVSMYPSIAVQERKRIPQVLLNYIETEK